MQAIILAAGMGKRLKELTSEATKCMVKVKGVAMIDRMMGHLDKLGQTWYIVNYFMEIIFQEKNDIR